jgi:hypothetical protein
VEGPFYLKNRFVLGSSLRLLSPAYSQDQFETFLDGGAPELDSSEGTVNDESDENYEGSFFFTNFKNKKQAFTFALFFALRFSLSFILDLDEED